MAICRVQNIEGYSQTDYRIRGRVWAIAGALLALGALAGLYRRTRRTLVFSAVAIPASALCFYRAYAYFQIDEPEEEEELEVPLVELPTLFEGVPSLKDLTLETLIDTADPAEIPRDLHQQLMDFAIRRGIDSFRRLLPHLEVTKLDLGPLGDYIGDDDLRAIAQHQPHLHQLHVCSSRVKLEAFLPLLSEEITHLTCGFLGANRPALVAALRARCPYLSHLRIGRDLDVEVLRSFPYLESFNGRLDASNYTGVPIPCLAQLKKLVSREIDGRILEQCTALESLHYNWRDLTVPAGCAGTLKELWVSDEVNWPENTVFGKLTSLEVDNAQPLDWDVDAFPRGCPALVSLKFGIIHGGTVPLREVIPHIGRLAPNLQSLVCRWAEDGEFAAVWPLVGDHLPNLKQLELQSAALDAETARRVLASPMRVKFGYQPWVEGLSLEEMVALSGSFKFAEDQVGAFYKAALRTPRLSWAHRSSRVFTAELAALLQPTDALKIRRTLILPFDGATAYDAAKVLRHCPHLNQPHLLGRGATGPTPTQWRRIGQALSRVAYTFLHVGAEWEFGREHFAGLVGGLGGGVTVNLRLKDSSLTAAEGIEVLEDSPRDFRLYLLGDSLRAPLHARFPDVVR